MSAIQLPTRSSSVPIASEFSAIRPPGGGHPPSPLSYAPGADFGAGEAADPAKPAGITRKDRDLSEQEQQTLRDCERTIRKGLQAFFTVGHALLQIQHGRLYRQTHPTFQAYCQGRFGLSHSHAYRHIEGAKVLQHLSPIGDKPMPANEAQTRPLVPLAPEGRLEVWRRVLATTTPPEITAKVVESAVREFLRSQEADRGRQGEPPGDPILEIDAEVVRDAADPGANPVQGGAGLPPEAAPRPTGFAGPSRSRPSAGLSGSTRAEPVGSPPAPTSVAMVPLEAVAPPTRSGTNPLPDGTPPGPVTAPGENPLAPAPEGDGGELVAFPLADGSTAQVHLRPGRRPTAAEILGTLAFIAKTYPNQQPPVSQPELIQSQRLLLECAARINRCIGDRPRVELCRAVQRLGGELNDLIVRPRPAA